MPLMAFGRLSRPPLGSLKRCYSLVESVIIDVILEALGSLPTYAVLLSSTLISCFLFAGSPSECATQAQRRHSLRFIHRAMSSACMSEALERIKVKGEVAVDTISEWSQDFTDSAYTSHEHRENILLLADRIRLQLNQLLRVGVSLEQKEALSPSGDLDAAISAVLTATTDLRTELHNTALEQASEIVRGGCEESELMSALKNSGLATDQERLDEYSDRFLEHIEHIQEVCKLLRHVAPTEALQVAAKYNEINLKIYGPQVVTAAQTLCLYPTSKIAKENVEVFCDVWMNLVGDVKLLTKDINDQILAENKPAEKQVYMSLPRPGKHGTTSKTPKPTRLDQEEQAKLAKSGLDMKMASSEVDQEAEKWEERISQDEDNDIVKRAKNMSSMAFSMYQFTRGEGALRTTQDLFTQGEYFAEEANRLYKVVRQFSYQLKSQVPAGPHKKELMEYLDQIPTHVQLLQYSVKNPTVGKAATFTKVDTVIQETKNLMNVISKVVTTCFVCATKYNLDFRGLSPRGGRGASPYRTDGEDVSGSGGGGLSGGGGESGGSM
ncbi:Vinculin/alpha-catenin [Trinorchestia longiramus]|nr:Vinculin/alpha-catenin [Trinorchestia longiramus]